MVTVLGTLNCPYSGFSMLKLFELDGLSDSAGLCAPKSTHTESWEQQ